MVINIRMRKTRALESLKGNWAVSIGVAAVASLLGGLIAGIGNLVLNPYKNAAITAFYQELKRSHPYL